MFMKKKKHYVSCMFLLGIVGAYVWMISRNGYGIRSKAVSSQSSQQLTSQVTYGHGRSFEASHAYPSEYENYINYPNPIKKKDKSAR